MALADAEELLEVYRDAQTMQHLTADLPQTVDGARALVQRKMDLYEFDGQLSLWAVVLRETGRVVGDIGLQHEDYGHGPEVGLGGRGNRAFWRLGLGLGAALDAGFTQLGLDRIGAETAPGNVPVQQLWQRLGMREVGQNPSRWPSTPSPATTRPSGSAGPTAPCRGNGPPWRGRPGACPPSPVAGPTGRRDPRR